ncbi:MAG: CU044_2847 family protein [Anaerolineae bacterium]
MARFIEFPLEEGGTVLLEVNETGDGRERPLVRGELAQASRGEKLLQNAEQSFDTAVDNVRKAANVLLTKLKSLHDAPDEVEISFGLKATGELGGSFVVAKAGLEANYNVKLTWKKASGSQ